ncbi:DNA-binding protein Spo0J-like [[Clostridium] ultunense Esp]|nr:DNA-binding protein Spo0J-like [[Clostridium] ultunense Esp]
MKEQWSKIFGFQEKKDGEEERISHIPVSSIVPNPFQPRFLFDDEKLEELSETIRTHGMIQPIVVRKTEKGFELIAGERRWRAYQKLNYEKIPAIIKEYSDAQAASAALIENLQREGLTSIEEALAYQKLMALHQLTQEGLAQRLGKGQSTIANKIRLLQLPEEVQQSLMERRITERHARALLTLKEKSTQLKLLHEIIEKDLSVKQTEQRVEQLQQKDLGKKKPKRISIPRDVRIAVNTIRQSVQMVMKTGMNIESKEEDHGDFYQVVIRIPKKGGRAL